MPTLPPFRRHAPVLWITFVAGALMSATDASAQAGARTVLINRVRLAPQVLQDLEERFQTIIPAGRYWYDRTSGAWGQEGGPTQGITLAGFDLGGPLPADISGRGTGVFINGRELHAVDLMGLTQLVGSLAPGRYWVDAAGNAGQEGGPATVNLRVLAAQQQQLWRGSGAGVGESYGGGGMGYGNLNTGIGIITDGQGGAAVFNH